MFPKKPDTISESLLADILRGDYGADRPLPKETDLAEAFGVSRGTIRAAVQSLEDHGIVAVVHGRAGSTVQPASEWSLFDASLLRTLLASPIGRAVRAEARECRLLLATEAAALAAERASPDEVEELRALLQRVRGRTRAGPASSPEVEFLHAVVEAAHNRFLTRALMPLEVALTTGTTRRAVEKLERIFDAIASGDADEARAAMRARLS